MPDKKISDTASLVTDLDVVVRDISAWDAFYLSMFWMLNTIGWTHSIGIGNILHYG
jgi:hypothetical protein